MPGPEDGASRPPAGLDLNTSLCLGLLTRPSETLTGGIRVGLDLGGTKIEGIALDSTGLAVARRRVATPRGDHSATVEAVAALAEGLEREAGRAATVGVGMPGMILAGYRASGRMRFSNPRRLAARSPPISSARLAAKRVSAPDP